jgi:hypothetical protein
MSLFALQNAANALHLALNFVDLLSKLLVSLGQMIHFLVLGHLGLLLATSVACGGLVVLKFWVSWCVGV